MREIKWVYAMIDDEQRKRHAARSWRLAIMTAGLICALVLVLPLVSPLLNGYSLFRFPLGLFLTAQGSIIGVIAVIYWAASRQDKLDRRHGLTSEL